MLPSDLRLVAPFHLSRIHCRCQRQPLSESGLRAQGASLFYNSLRPMGPPIKETCYFQDQMLFEAYSIRIHPVPFVLPLANSAVVHALPAGPFSGGVQRLPTALWGLLAITIL